MSQRLGSAAVALWLVAGSALAEVTTRGTEFWACHMENKEAARWAPLGLCFANEGSELVTVRVEGNTGTLATSLVQPGRVQTVVLPNDRMLFGTTIQPFGYHVVADRPIRAFEFNPILNSRSDDATLLLPVQAAGTTHRIVSRAASTGLTGDLNPSSFTVIGTTLEPTSVTIIPTGNVAAGAGGRIPATPAGTPIDIVLSRFEVAQFQTEGTDQDFTGTLITSDFPVIVLNAHVCPNVPEGVGYCDHLEEQAFPTGTWGRDFAAVKTFPRGTEPDYWRIVAHEDGTQITLTPDVVGGAPITLAAGAFVEFATTQDVHVVASKPVQLAQFLVGRLFDASMRTGDPSLLLTVPSEQYDTDLLFITPNNYQDDYITIVAPTGSPVSLDGTLVAPSSFVPVSTSGMSRARLPVAEGVHRVACAAGVAVYVYGYDLDVSYGYSAGARAEPIATGIHCDAGGPYETCTGVSTIPLDGRGSNGIGALTYLWSPQSPGVTILDNAAAVTDAALVGGGPFSVSLSVSDGTNTSTCAAIISVTAGGPPDVTCEPGITVTPTELLGSWVPVSASVTDDCDTNPTLVNDRTPGGADASDFYPCGVTYVTFTGRDEGGMRSDCTTIVWVQGLEPPAEVSGSPTVEPLRVQKVPDGSLLLTFEDRRTNAEAHDVYRGTIPRTGMVGYDHVSVACGLVAAPVAPGVASYFAPELPGASHYFLVSASNCFQEGSKGSNSAGEPRPQLPADCGPLR